DHCVLAVVRDIVVVVGIKSSIPFISSSHQTSLRKFSTFISIIASMSTHTEYRGRNHLYNRGTCISAGSQCIGIYSSMGFALNKGMDCLGINLLQRRSYHVHLMKEEKNIHMECEMRFDWRRWIISFTNEIKYTLIKRATLLT